MDNELEIGRVVMAKAGRDKGKYFLVIGRLDTDYVLIANGYTRSINKPKKKKEKHLEPKKELIKGIKEKIESRRRIFDGEIKNALEALGYKG